MPFQTRLISIVTLELKGHYVSMNRNPCTPVFQRVFRKLSRPFFPGMGIALWSCIIPASAHVDERILVASTFSDASLPCTTLQGNWSKAPEGLRGDADSRIGFSIPGASAIWDGKVAVTFVPPKHNKPLVPLKEDNFTCLCAFKILLGRTVAEISERWVRFSQLDKSYEKVDSILISRPFTIDQEMSEMSFAVSINNGTGSIVVNDSNILSARLSDYSFEGIELAAYHMPFVVTSLKVSEYSKISIKVDKKNHCLELTARYLPSQFNAGRGLANHHLMAWKGGRAANAALFATYASDSAVDAALLATGAQPGDNLSIDTWEKRERRASGAPDRKIEGSSIKVEIISGGKVFPVVEFLKDFHAKPFDFRFGGNRKNAPVWQTGCVVCLESCPAGNIGNHSYSMRDLVTGKARFEKVNSTSVKENDDVVVRFTVAHNN